MKHPGPRQSAGCAPVDVLYVAGIAHCGSTIVSRVLGEVEGVFAAGEVYALATRTQHGDTCGCGASLAACPFWTSVVASAFPEGDGLERLPRERSWVQGRWLPLLALGRDRERVDAYRATLPRLYRAIAERSGAPVVVDSSKSPTYAWLLARAPGVRLSIVHLLRDPRAVSYSWSVDPHFHRTRGPAFGARWALWNVELDLMRAARPSRVITLRYEDFVENPPAATRRMLELVGAERAELPFEDDGNVRLPRHHMIEGHASRFETGLVSIHRRDAWLERLSPRRDLATSLCSWPVQRLHGYSVRRAGRDL